MDTQTLTLILTFLGAQIAAILAVYKWHEELRFQINSNASRSSLERAELRGLVVAVLAEMGIKPIVANGELAGGAAPIIDSHISQESQ